MSFFTVDWGDGTTNTVDEPSIPWSPDMDLGSFLGADVTQHTYLNSGTYTVTVTVDYPTTVAPNGGVWPTGEILSQTFTVIVGGEGAGPFWPGFGLGQKAGGQALSFDPKT